MVKKIQQNNTLLKTALLSITVLKFAIAQSGDYNSSSIKQSTLDNFYRLEIYTATEDFCKILIANEIPLNQSNPNNQIIIEVEISDFSKKYNDKYNSTIAFALGSNVDSLIKLDINRPLWAKLSTLEKMATIYHELCHDVLNVQHVPDDDLNLMHPSSQPKNLNELDIMLNKFLRDWLHNRVKTFEDGFFVHDVNKEFKPYITKNL